MKKHRKLFGVLSLSLIISILSVVILSNGQPKDAPLTEEKHSAVSASSPNILPPLNAFSQQEPAYTVISSYVIPYIMDDLIAESTLVIKGTVTEKQPVQFTDVEGKNPMDFAEYVISIEGVLRGDAEDVSSVAVYVLGDFFDSTFIYTDMPELEPGKSYILFLVKDLSRGDYGIPGGVYLIVGQQQGVFELDEEDVIKDALSTGNKLRSIPDNNEYFISQRALHLAEEENLNLADTVEDIISPEMFKQEDGVTEEILALSALEEKLEEADETMPVDEDARQENAFDAMEENLKNGMITQEEYNHMLKNMHSTKYGKIIRK